MKENQPGCSDVLRFICDNLDENLNSPHCVEIKEHLSACTQCAAYLKSMKDTVQFYRLYPIPEISEPAKISFHELLDRLKS